MASRVDVRSAVVVRLAARGPRYALMLGAAVLSLAGLASILRPAAALPPPRTVRAPSVDWAAQAAAEISARRLVGGTASHVIGDEARGRGQRLVTVGVTAPRPAAVAVLVTRDARGSLVVDEPPAIVGQTAVRDREVLDGAREVTDAGLLRVVRRVVRNYLTGEGDDVAADLVPGTPVALPGLSLEPRPVDSVTWLVAGRRVAVRLSARLPSGALVELRYELGVRLSGGRWLISQIHVNPLHQEVRP